MAYGLDYEGGNASRLESKKEVIHVNVSICYLLGTCQWAAVLIVLF